jgi:hypothetical protein
MKTIDSRRVVLMGGLVAVIVAAGCFGGDRAYSNSPYAYNGAYYRSRPYDGGYGNPYPYNSGYNDTHSYPQSFGNSNSYSAGLQHGVPAEASRDDRQVRAADQHVAVTHDRSQAQTEKQRASVDHGDYSRKDSPSAHPSERD